MSIARLVLVGVKHPGLCADFTEHGYECVSADDIDSAAALAGPWDLALIDRGAAGEPLALAIERMRFVGDNVPVCVCVDGPAEVDDALRSVAQNGLVEIFYYEESASGVAVLHTDRLLLYTRLNTGLQTFQTDLRDRDALARELTLRKHVADHERDLNANILASISSGVLVVDLEGLVVLMNEHTRPLLGITVSNALGLNLDSIAPRQFVRLVRALLRRAQSSPALREVRKLEIEGRHLQVTGYTMLDSARSPSGLLLFVQDVTEQEDAAQQLYRAEKLATIGTMMSGISHELRNPLAIISARCQMALQKKLPDPEAASKALESIEKQTERCAEIVNRLLDFTRQRATAMACHKVAEVLDEALSYLQYQNVFDDITVRKDYGANLEVFGDRSRYVQAFLNVISNAADAMEGQGTLTFATTGDGCTTIVEINDTGPGIDPSIQHRIFDPFYTTKDPGSGTGLGLAIVNKIVSESGGRVRVVSRPGSTSFFIELPSIREHAHA